MLGYAVCEQVGGEVAGWYFPETHAMLMLSDLHLSELPPTRDHDCWLASLRSGDGSYIIKKPRRSDPTHREYFFMPLVRRHPTF